MAPKHQIISSIKHGQHCATNTAAPKHQIIVSFTLPVLKTQNARNFPGQTFVYLSDMSASKKIVTQICESIKCEVFPTKQRRKNSQIS